MQYTFEPYGTPAILDELVAGPLPTNRLGHQGLFFERLHTAVAESLLTTPALAPRSLDPSAPSVGLYLNRNRWLSPELGRFLQRDPNETTLPIVTAIAYNGDALAIVLGVFDPQAHYADGLNLYAYLGSNPLNLRDPLGLVFDPFEDVDEVIGSMYAERIVHAQDMMVFFVAMGEMAAHAVIEGMISVFVPGGVYLVMGYHLIHAANDIEENGLNFWNGLEAVGSAIPLGGALWRGFTRHLDDLSRLRPPRARASGIAPCPILRHVCFAGGTPVLLADGSTAPIEDVGIGAVVWSAPDPTLPAGWVAGDPTSPDAYTTIDTATWRRVTLRVVDGPKAQMHIELLRPPAWFEAVAPVPGGTVQFDFPELRLAATAHVVAIGPCPDIPAMYDGSIVTGRFVTERAPVLALTVIGQEEPVRVTARHPFFSADRGGWVAAGDLRPSERVRTQGGYATIGAITLCTATETVYNLEIHRHHTLYVSRATLWAHNTCTKAQVRDIARWWKLDGPRVHPKLGRTSHGQEWFTDGSKWYTFDVDGHRGGIWKVFDRNGNRLCTVDIDGNIVGK